MFAPESLPQPLWDLLWELMGRALSRLLGRPRRVDHNLPGEAPRPIGREQALRWLREQLSPSSPSAVCALVGPGGVGKTYLALAIAHEHLRWAESRLKRLRDWLCRHIPGCRPSGVFEAIIYISAQNVLITPGGIRSQRAQTRLSEITAEIARTLNDQDLLRQPPPEREQSVLRAMSRRRTLLILDGMEGMDPSVLGFIGRVPSPSRVLITSRYLVNSWPAYSLEALDPKSARRLIHWEAAEKGLELTSEAIERLAQATGGLPLAISISVARLKRGISMDTLLEELREGRGDLAEYMVGRSVEALRQDQDAYRLFLALALFDPGAGAHRAALGAIADLPKERCDAGLVKLVEWSLIKHEQKADRFRFHHPLIHARAVRALEEDQEAPAFRQRWIEWYQARLAERPQNIPLLRAERPNLLRILEALRQEDRMEELARCLWEARILLDEGPAEPYLEAIRSLFRWSLKRLRGDLLQGLTWDPLTRGGPVWKKEFTEQWWELLRPYLSDSHQAAIEARLLLWGESPEPIPLERVRSLLEQAFQDLKPERSEVEAEQAISVCNDSGLLLMGDRGGEPDYPAARAWFERGLELLRQCRDRLQDPKEWEAILRGNLALLIARAEGRYAEAMRILEEIRPHLRWKRDLAEWHLAMAVYAYRRCRMREALRYGREGDALLRELGREKLDTKEGREWLRIRARLNRPLGWIRKWLQCWLGRKGSKPLRA